MREMDAIKQGIAKIIDLVISLIVAIAAYFYGGWEAVGKAFASLLVATTLFSIGYFVYGYHKGSKEEREKGL